MSITSKPLSVEFTDLSIPASNLLRRGRQHLGPIKEDWFRVVVDLPDVFDASEAIYEWLKENNNHRWTSFTYSDPMSKGYGMGAYKMVVRFEDKNDAIMFKLRDGHKAYEHSND